ncbi:Protein of unknown function [Pyronema omphalodes CBS 100304]|uniref:Uncharacterized protein n=1 Tax=Pyronema omphalodes (strain CBS 100304) TaxID=1076935 RepID=U4LI38_PYROM|nr:Protein of unknown function [Pyronema omphalodes CBS 100304]
MGDVPYKLPDSPPITPPRGASALPLRRFYPRDSPPISVTPPPDFGIHSQFSRFTFGQPPPAPPPPGKAEIKHHDVSWISTSTRTQKFGGLGGSAKVKPELPLIDIPKPAIPEITVNPGTPMPEETVTHTLKVNVDDVLTPAVMERFYRRFHEDLSLFPPRQPKRMFELLVNTIQSLYAARARETEIWATDVMQKLETLIMERKKSEKRYMDDMMRLLVKKEALKKHLAEKYCVIKGLKLELALEKDHRRCKETKAVVASVQRNSV